jgi:nitrous oxide reductase accessory protein NosL
LRKLFLIAPGENNYYRFDRGEYHMRRLLTAVTLVLLAASLACAGVRAPVKATPKEKCPVCGMFVAKYPDFAAQIIFRDGSAAHFDGAKDMFKYFLGINRYNKSKTAADIEAVYVTDYYDLTMIDGQSAYYVIGSDVMGPMGKELVSFRKEADAREFAKDHKGKKIVRFKDVNGALMEGLD